MTHLIRQGFDHTLLHLVCNLEMDVVMKPFKFLTFWTKHPDFKKLVKDNSRVDFKGLLFTEVQAKMRSQASLEKME